jgi:hypothetical protein
VIRFILYLYKSGTHVKHSSINLHVLFKFIVSLTAVSVDIASLGTTSIEYLIAALVEGNSCSLV